MLQIYIFPRMVRIAQHNEKFLSLLGLVPLSHFKWNFFHIQMI